MGESIAWAIYLIGALAVITGPLDQPRQPWIQILTVAVAAIFWPIGALILVAARAARRLRHG